MANIKILDCTLRDGGYCNQWDFKKENIEKILQNLQEAKIDIIECGYLSKVEKGKEDRGTKFSNPDRLKELVSRIDKPCVAMVNFGELSLEETLIYGDIVSGIRVAFHKDDWKKAVEYCNTLIQKGVHVYMQPMVSMNYNIQEFKDLLGSINEIKPYAVYIVDSFGSMQVKDIEKYLVAAMEILEKSIYIGFHGHNNMQMALSNAIQLLYLSEERDVIIDTCIRGMGRGAGNLNTEMFVEYCNKTYHSQYLILPLMQLIDEVIEKYYEKSPWGYAWPYYVSAIHGCHPNYAKFLDEKKTLNYLELYDIMVQIDMQHRNKFNEKYIETLYLQYMSRNRSNISNEELWMQIVKGKKVLLLAPGKNVIKYSHMIYEYIDKEQPIVIGINMDYKLYHTDYIFISNLRRFHDWTTTDSDKERLIVTSNIPAENQFLKVSYESLVSKQEKILDNAGIMVLNFLKKYQISEIALAGFDGYVYANELNYVDENVQMDMSNQMIDEMNRCIRSEIRELTKKAVVRFLTPSMYEKYE